MRRPLLRAPLAGQEWRRRQQRIPVEMLGADSAPVTGRDVPASAQGGHGHRLTERCGPLLGHLIGTRPSDISAVSDRGDARPTRRMRPTAKPDPAARETAPRCARRPLTRGHPAPTGAIHLPVEGTCEGAHGRTELRARTTAPRRGGAAPNRHLRCSSRTSRPRPPRNDRSGCRVEHAGWAQLDRSRALTSAPDLPISRCVVLCRRFGRRRCVVRAIGRAVCSGTDRLPQSYTNRTRRVAGAPSRVVRWYGTPPPWSLRHTAMVGQCERFPRRRSVLALGSHLWRPPSRIRRRLVRRRAS
jgi:hypothetical protein